MSNFHVGQKVVCIDDQDFVDRDRKVARHGLRYPEVGKVYSVRAVLEWGGGICVRLNEITNPKILYIGDALKSEQAFAAFRFRPVVERKTDISIFTAMLNTQRTRVSA